MADPLHLLLAFSDNSDVPTLLMYAFLTIVSCLVLLVLYIVLFLFVDFIRLYIWWEDL